MTHRAIPRSTARIRRRRAALLAVVVAAAVAALGDQVPGSSPSSSTSTAATPPAPVAPRHEPRRPRTGLDPALLKALRRAARDAAREGVELTVVSGRRSPEHQRRLLDEAVAKYGSEAEAARWVATPETSPHVSGDAVDIGPSAAEAWLSAHGASYGLCQIYANEPWHFELRPDALDRGCPEMYPDPTHDPRMHP